ncbi:MAG TPA: ribokinase [Candidatus Limnocylindrales bacterium]|jgi:ribokinase
MVERDSGEVIVVGSANVDLTIRAGRLPAPGETVIGGVFSRQAGGKGSNQAVAAATYGCATRLVAAVGDDPLADEVLDALRAAGVATGGVARLPDTATGVALIVVDAQGENQIAVASGANSALSGSLVSWALGSVEPAPWSACLIGFEIGDEAVVAAATWAHAAGVLVIVNPAPARPLPAGLLGMAPILTPNAAEAMVLTGDADPAEAGRLLRARSGAAVVVTLGGKGALILDDAGETHVPALTIAPVDATGAGDVFNGILAAELASRTELRAAARLAVAGASLSTRSAGAQAGMPTRDEVAAALAP